MGYFSICLTFFSLYFTIIMMKNLSDIILRLNEAISLENSLPYNVNFLGGNLAEEIGETANKLAPLGKVAFLYTKNSFEKIGKDISLSVRKLGIKTVNVILPEGDREISEMCKLFNLPEDVRMVFVADRCHYQTASYFCTVNAIPCGYIIGNTDFEDAISYSATVKNGDSYDRITLDCTRYIIIDENCFENSAEVIPDNYVKMMSSLVSLIDYRINCYFNGKNPSKQTLKIIDRSTREIFPLMNKNREEQAETLLYNGLLLQLANLLAEGQLQEKSALFATLEMLSILNGGKKEQANAGLILEISLRILQIYKLYFSGNYKNLPDTPDYTKRAEYLAGLNIDSELEFLKNYQNQINIVKTQDKENLDDFFQAIFSQVESVLSAFIIVQNTYISLGGRKIADKNLNTAMKYSGDVIGSFNAMTLLRDAGFMEFPCFEEKFK